MYKELPDAVWERIAPLLEPFQRRVPGGKASVSPRSLLDGVLYHLVTGCQWERIPRCYGAKSTIYEHYRDWGDAGIFDQILALSLDVYEARQGVAWEWEAMDGSLIPAPGCGCASEEALGPNPTDRGRGGSKLHLLVDERGIPLSLEVAGANVNDGSLATTTLDAALLEKPEDTVAHLCLDKGYDSARVQAEALKRGYLPHIKKRGIREEATPLPQGSRYPARRWVVERTLAWFKAFRALRTRFARLRKTFWTLVCFAAALIVFRTVGL